MEVKNFKDEFVLLTSDSNPRELRQIGRSLFEAQLDAIKDVVVSEMEICIIPELGIGFDTLLLSIGTIELDKVSVTNTLFLPVCFDLGRDWKTLEEQSNMTRQSIIGLLSQSEFELSHLGFMPGFLYLTGMPESLHCERLSTPRTLVESGTVAIGGKYLGVYGLQSPGGWHSIGATPVKTYYSQTLPSYHPGSIIKIVSISLETFELLKAKDLYIHEYHG